MINRFQFGTPIPTDSVVKQLPICDWAAKGSLFKLTEEAGSYVFSCKMEKADAVYGLGEQNRGINKRGFRYISNATDDPVHTENKHSLYGAHNFFILSGEKNTGVYVDTPGKVTFDIGDTVIDQLVVRPGKNFDLYILEEESLKDIVREFRELTGPSYIPPKWAFGYQQSRWGYENEGDIRRVVENHRSRNIPLESVFMDIDYMERFKDFTVDEKKFPEFPAFVKEMKEEQGVYLVPIIDAGVKIEDGYSVYEEGVAGDYFCKEEDGENFVGAVWPGKVHFPDFLNSRTREWFGEKYGVLLDAGIEGFWNDMNEPAIFYSEKNLKKVLAEVGEMKDMNLDINSFFHLQDIVGGLSNNETDYSSFYHNVGGKKVCHADVHNIYGMNMTRAASEAFDKLVPDKRILMFSRSSYIGMHRYGGIWTGDNNSWWQQLQLSICQMPSLSMCGFLYVGSDIGGFGSDTTEDLLLRWNEFAMFTPLMRNHSALGTREQEVYRFERIDDFRNLIRMRYALIPYLYSEYMKCALKNEMFFSPLSFVWSEDEQAREVEDQLLVGESIMIAPVYQANKTGRYVYLPEEMLMVRMRAPEERTYEVLSKGHHYVKAELNEVLIFVRKDHLLPMAVLKDEVRNTKDLADARMEWIGYTDDKASYILYEDDGCTRNYTPEEEWKRVEVSAGQFGNNFCF